MPWHRGKRPGPSAPILACFALLIAAGCGEEVAAPVLTTDLCAPAAPEELLTMNGERFFDASFALALCESAAISASDAIEAGFLTIRAPRPGFDEFELVSFAQELVSHGIRPIAVHFYVLDDDRVGIAQLGVRSSLVETLDTATAQLTAAFSEDSRTNAASRVPYVLVVGLQGANLDEVSDALAALRGSAYAFSLGSLQGVPPPFDPARDRTEVDH